MHEHDDLTALKAMGVRPRTLAQLQARGLSLDKVLKLIQLLPGLLDWLRKSGLLEVIGGAGETTPAPARAARGK